MASVAMLTVVEAGASDIVGLTGVINIRTAVAGALA